MKIHHLNLGTMCPYGGRLLDGGMGPIFAKARLVIHALLMETGNGLVLVEAGFGLDTVRAPKERLGTDLLKILRPVLREDVTAIRQIERLGYTRDDVRDVVVTHLDVDHAGGIADFPAATIHIHRDEHAAAVAGATFVERHRYRVMPYLAESRFSLHDTAGGERWFGFESVRAVADDVLLIPLPGHTRGHAGVAVRVPPGSSYGPKTEWLLHCGDAYFFHEEMSEPPACPLGLRVFQRVLAVDNEKRLANAARLRSLRRDEPDRVRLFSAHSPAEYDCNDRYATS